MQRLLKFLHVSGSAGFIGSVAATLAATVTAGSPGSSEPAAACIVAVDAIRWVALPSLLLLVIAGLLSIALRPAFLDQRWLWAKAVLGIAAGGIALVVVLPGLRRLAALTVAVSPDQPIDTASAATLGTVSAWSAAIVLLALAATALGVWRPRLAGGAD